MPKEPAKKVVRKPAPRRARAPKTASPPAPEHVAERAYYISLEAGGDPFANWLRAERELAAR